MQLDGRSFYPAVSDKLDSQSSSSGDCLPVTCHQLTCSQPHSDPPRRRGSGKAVSCTRQAPTSAAVCLKPTSGAVDKSGAEKKRQLVLLSCSHMFHATCLQAMEDFTAERPQHVCPVCRSHYHTKLVNTWLNSLLCWLPNSLSNSLSIIMTSVSQKHELLKILVPSAINIPYSVSQWNLAFPHYLEITRSVYHWQAEFTVFGSNWQFQ